MNWKAIVQTAIRDSRRDRSKFMLFMSSIVVGVAALVAINSFNANLLRDIDSQAKTLLGADLVVSGDKPLDEALRLKLDSVATEGSDEVELFSMAYLPQQGESQFVRIKAVAGGFPYYGKLGTIPSDAAQRYKSERIALVDDGMMLQYELEIGDSIRLGQATFEIGGRLTTAFGSIQAGSSFAPPVYISKTYIDATELIQPGSMVDYTYAYKSDLDVDAWRATNKETFRSAGFRLRTVEGQKENLSEAFSRLNEFLNLVALISLLLACIGVASSVMIYVRSKLSNIAILRCIGMTGEEAFFVYFLQISVLGGISVLLGAALGSIIQVLLPIILKSFLPFEVAMSISLRAIIVGVVVGLLITLLFALAPMLAIRKVSPLRAMRVSDEAPASDRWTYLVYFAIVLTIWGFVWSLVGDGLAAMAFTAGILLAFGILYAVAIGVVWAARKFLPRRASFVFRQGVSNLYRPNNQTRTLIVSIGLGTAILTTLYILQSLILSNVESMDAGKQPNMILYGIETAQKEELESITTSMDMPILQHVPVVTMDLEEWQGKTKQEWLEDTTRTARRWAINREARVSYQAEMNPDEELISGTYKGTYDGDSIWISLGQRYAEGLDVGIGDELVWNVQGALIKTYVGSIRKLEFRRLESRFFILFPVGVLEEAPQFHILVTKSPSKAVAAKYRNAVVKNLPNVSVIDLDAILVTLNDLLGKVSYVIRFMAGFSILIGLIVLLSSLYLSKFQRIRESTLLHTLGAVRRQIFQISAVEYAALGLLSALTGVGLAIAGSYMLAQFVFDLEYSISILPILIIVLLVVGLTVGIGLWNSRDVVNHSPLEVLRR